MSTTTAQPFFDNNFHRIIVDYCLWKYAERAADPTIDPIYFRGEWENGKQLLLDYYESKLITNDPIPGPEW